jgi:hypothetical protein
MAKRLGPVSRVFNQNKVTHRSQRQSSQGAHAGGSHNSKVQITFCTFMAPHANARPKLLVYPEIPLEENWRLARIADKPGAVPGFIQAVL